MTGSISSPWPSLPTTTHRIPATMVTPFFANKGFHPKLEVFPRTCCVGYCSPGCDRPQGAPYVPFVTRYLVPSNNTRSTLCRDPSRSPIQGRRHCLARLAEHRNHAPVKKLTSLPGTFPIVEKVSSHAFRLGLSLALSCNSPRVPCVTYCNPLALVRFPTEAVDPPPPVEFRRLQRVGGSSDP